jgi:hypothetical protein
MQPDWLMNQFSGLVPPNGMQVSGIHFQHPDQPLSAAALPQTHPLKTRIVTLLQALHFMRDWQVNPFCRGFATSRSITSYLGFVVLPGPQRSDTRGGAASGPFFRAPVISGWIWLEKKECLLIPPGQSAGEPLAPTFPMRKRTPIRAPSPQRCEQSPAWQV